MTAGAAVSRQLFGACRRQSSGLVQGLRVSALPAHSSTSKLSLLQSAYSAPARRNFSSDEGGPVRTTSKGLNTLKRVDHSRKNFSTWWAAAPAWATSTTQYQGWRDYPADKLPDWEWEYDAVLIGGGIMSWSVGVMLQQLEPTWRILIVEQLDAPALESSNAWNNAGTGHAALCELNYTAMDDEGFIDCSKWIDINEKFMTSRQFWAYLLENGKLADTSFINTTPHMSFVWGQGNCEFLKKRYELLKEEPLFNDMVFSEDFDEIKKWAPLLMEGRTK